MQIGRSGIEACFDAQRPVLCCGDGKSFTQILFANQFGEALFQIRQLLVDGGK